MINEALADSVGLGQHGKKSRGRLCERFFCMSKDVNSLLAEVLAQSCRDFCRHGAEHLFKEKPARDDVTQAVLNLQGAMEAGAKLFQLKKKGWRSVVESQFKSLSEEDALRKFQSDKLKMIRYEEAKQFLIASKQLEPADETLMRKLQRYRNSIAHVGLATVPAATIDEAKRLMVRVLNSLAWNALAGKWMDVFLENQSSKVLGAELFWSVRRDACYVSEAVELAEEHSKWVRKCPECRCPTWAEVEFETMAVLCFCCGYGLADGMAKFEDCPNCGSKDNLFYDGLNTENGNPVGAQCVQCREKMEVIECPDCGKVMIYTPKWTCKECGLAG